MARSSRTDAKDTRAARDEVVHLQVSSGETVVYRGPFGQTYVYGDRATLQVPRRDLDRLNGSYEEVDPGAVPDVAAR